MTKKQDQETEELETQPEIPAQKVTKEEKEEKKVEKETVVLMNTQSYAIFVPYYDNEFAISPRARVRVEVEGLKDPLPEHIYKV